MSDDYEPSGKPAAAPLRWYGPPAILTGTRRCPVVTNAGEHDVSLAPDGTNRRVVLKPGESATWPGLERVEVE